MTPEDRLHLPGTALWRSVFLGRALDPAQHAFQRELMRRRVRALALVLAVAIPAWIPFDLIGMGADGLTVSVLARLALAALALGVAQALRRPERAGWALPLLALLVLLQCLGFCAAHALLNGGGHHRLIELGYALFPFVVMAQLALFPLPVLHGLVLGLPLLLIRAAALIWLPEAESLHHVADLWLMLLLMLVALWAAAAQLALLLGLVDARRDASHDALTGLANRRAALDRMRAEAARAARERQPLSVLMLDLDRFKRINDQWGHATGDEVLVATAGILRSELRGADLGVRFGGEEFLAILPGTDLEAACHVAERIRQRVAACALQTRASPEPIRFTLSIGAASLQHGESPEALVERADAALYRAKEGGRDRVEADSPAAVAA